GYFGLGRAYHATGHPDQALEAHQHAFDLVRDLNPGDQARAHDGLARVHHTLGHPDQARHHWQTALDILTTLGTPAADDVTAVDIRAHLARLDTPTRRRRPDAAGLPGCGGCC